MSDFTHGSVLWKIGIIALISSTVEKACRAVILPMPYKELVVSEPVTAYINRRLLHRGLPRSRCVRRISQHLPSFTEVHLGSGLKNTSLWFSWKYNRRTVMSVPSATTITDSSVAVFRADNTIGTELVDEA